MITIERLRELPRNAGLKGVTRRYNGVWVAQIAVNKKKITVGRFATPELAHQAYQRAAAQHFGEFARFE